MVRVDIAFIASTLSEIIIRMTPMFKYSRGVHEIYEKNNIWKIFRYSF